MGFWAMLAPTLISGAASVLGGLTSKKPKTDPAVTARMNLENSILRTKQGFLNQLDQYLGRGTLLDSEGKPLTLRLGEGWPKSLNEFMQAADFGSKRDLDNLIQFIQLANPGSNTSGAVQQGAMASAMGAERNASALGKMFDTIGQAAWDKYGVGGTDGVAKELTKIVSREALDEMIPGNGAIGLDTLDLITKVKGEKD